ncbi:MAG: type II toxin-antitoxin system prevent-host-death family antitoxin [Planctomycetota bacterium]
MKTVSMLDFRMRAAEVLRGVRRGERMVLTYRGKPVARLEAWEEPSKAPDDAFFRLPALAERTGKALTNAEMDRLIYGD